MDPSTLERRIKVLTFIQCAVSPFSLLGSLLTLVSIQRRFRIQQKLRPSSKALSPTYLRLMTAISIFDFIQSIGAVWGPLLQTPTFPYAHGTQWTCSIQGLLLQLGIGGFAYNAMLMIFYVLVIRFNIRNESLTKHVEPWMHTGVLLYTFTVAFAGLGLEVYNPTGLFCWNAAEPLGCDEMDEIDCNRGGRHVETFGLWLTVYSVFAYTGIIFLCALTVIFTVAQRHCKSRRFQFQGERHIDEQSSSRKQLNLVISQCLLYAFAFLNVTVWGTMGSIYYVVGAEYDSLGSHFWIAFLSLTFYPIQGAFNFLIFIRPTYLQHRSRGHSHLYAVQHSVWVMPAVDDISSHTSRKVDSKAHVQNASRSVSPVSSCTPDLEDPSPTVVVSKSPSVL